jgi:ABC-type Zn uptake system ZnuABC Zn-binding protein ZnuA
VRGALVALVLLCATATTTAAGGELLEVVTTSTDLRALVEAVGGDRVRAEHLASPAADPHTAEVTPGRLAKLRAAALLVVVGLDHEPWLARLLRTVGDPRFAPGRPHYLDASRNIEVMDAEVARVRPERGAHLHGLGNPHYWLDPANARPITEAITAALARLVPAERATFETNRRRFLARLDPALERWSTALAPHRGTRLVVVHDTWPYFARRFGLVVVAALEPTPGVPPSPQGLLDVGRRMRESGVKLVVADPASDPGLVAQVAARGGARAVTLAPSVGSVPEAVDYLALFDVNVARLTEALGVTR